MLVRDVTRRNPDPRSILPGLGLSSTLYGIEIEMENVQTRPACVWWTWVDDGSLRNNGAELVLSNPTGGRDLEDALQEFRSVVAALTAAQGEAPEITERCSVHTHVDFRGCSMQEVHAFFIGFCMFESALFTLGGKDRYSSIYCPGLSSCRPQIQMFNKLYKASNMDSVCRILDEWPKYTAVNLGSLMSHGSVEVRSHKGTAQPEDIIQWVQVLDKLKQYTSTVHPEQLVHIARKAGTRLLREVFGELSSSMMTDNYQQYRKNNIRNAQDCLFWHEIEAISRPATNDAEKLARLIIDFLES